MSCDYSLHRDRGQVVPQWHKTASKFQRIKCTICCTSPNNHQEKKSPHLKVMCLPVESVVTWCNVAVKVLQKTEVSGNSERLHSWRNASARNPWDHKISGTISKGWKNSMAGCCSLLRWITNLKFVNSVVRTVITHPEKGCLNWLHGTMSEPPWKSH